MTNTPPPVPPALIEVEQYFATTKMSAYLDPQEVCAIEPTGSPYNESTVTLRNGHQLRVGPNPTVLQRQISKALTPPSHVVDPQPVGGGK